MAKVYCKNCGRSFPDVRAMAGGMCQYHPDGSFKGRHVLYEGSEKTKYTCKYCGRRFHDIHAMAGVKCQYHPDGSFKGNHSPEL